MDIYIDIYICDLDPAAHPFAVLDCTGDVGHGVDTGEQALLRQVVLGQEVLVDVVK